MAETSIIHLPFLLLLPTTLFPNAIATLLIGGASAFILTYVLTFAVKAFCYKVNWLGRPEPGRILKKSIPRLGGIAIFLAFVVASLLFYSPGANSNSTEISIFWLLLAASTLIVIVHAYDDVRGLKPLPKFIAQSIAALIVMGPWIPTFRGVLLYYFSNPFDHLHLPWFHEANIYLFMTQANFAIAAIPAVFFTWFWVVGMMNTVNLIDGLDGLATGVVGITALFITIISIMLGQLSIAVLAAIFTGAVFGFMPHNWNPAKIIMGDSGAMFLGLGLAVLSIMGGAKLALALMVLGIPILDVAVVAINRMRRGQSAVHFDNSHMHYRLLATGLSVKQICLLFYGLTIMFGVLALRLSHIYKFIGLALVVLTMFCLILFVDRRLRQRGIPIHPPDPDPVSHGDGVHHSGNLLNDDRRLEVSEYSDGSLKIIPSSQA